MENHRFNRILLAVDNGPCTEKAIKYAKDLVHMFNSTLALITVLPASAGSSMTVDPILGQQPILIPEIMDIQLDESQSYLAELAKEFPMAKEVFIFNKVGSVRDEIIETAATWTADLIIMGSNGRTGFEHFIVGSVSESVLRRAVCPVLIVPSKCN